MLHIDCNQITDISPLSGLTELEYLYLSDNQITDISPLYNLKNLNQLGLWENPVSDEDKAALGAALGIEIY